MARTKKVLIVEDSTLLSKVIRDVLSNTKDLDVVGVAMNSREGWDMFESTKPDVITLDLMLPDGSGFDLLKRIMKNRPTPVVVISSLTGESATETFKAYEMGAADVIEKPSNVLSPGSKIMLSRLGIRIRRAADANAQILANMANGKAQRSIRMKKVDSNDVPARSIILIASSTGGPQILSKMMPLFGEVGHTGIIVIQHIPQFFSATLAQRLDKACPFKVKEAEDGEVVKEGTCLIAPGGVHLEAEMGANKNLQVRTTNGPAIKGVRPSADITFGSFAKYVNFPIVGIVMTGMGNDGLEGVIALKKNGSKIITQNKETCIVYGMPKAIEENGLSDRVLPFDRIPETAKKLIK